MIGWPLDLWQRWLAIHLGELFPDGSPRYRKAIILVARQNGKTIFTRLLILFWMWVETVPEILGTSTDRAAAKRSWLKVVTMAEQCEELAADLAPRHTALQIGEEDFWNQLGSHYRFAAPTRRAGRGDTLHRALLDELREHRNRDTWDAVIPAMGAVDDALVVCISNEGDAESTVLHEEYDSALTYLETGQGDRRTFLAAWSSPLGADPCDLEALAYANPNLGHRIPPDALLGEAITAKRAGGETLIRFRIERMCQRVDLLDPAIDVDAWRNSGTGQPLDLAKHRRQLALAFDVALDGSHCTLMAAAVVDGLVHVEVVKKWHGFGATKALRAELPGLVAKIRPRVLVWLPSGPAAAVAAALAEKRGQWPPRRVEVREVRSDVAQICMGAAEIVSAGELRHPRDPMLDQHVGQTGKAPRGDQWVFARRGSGPIDGTYAMAAAVDAARTLPAPPPPLAVA
jgi:phage terminase large subunit-like protein